jgi:hypothetical protein
MFLGAGLEGDATVFRGDWAAGAFLGAVLETDAAGFFAD